MSDKEKQEMLEKLLAEGLSQEEAEAQVLQASAEDAEEPTEEDTEDAQVPVEEDASDDVDAEEPTEDTEEDTEDEEPTEVADTEGEPDTFDRAYVQKLRKEAAKYRDKAKRAEELEQRLHQALVAQDGRLADPSDLPFDETHLDDPDALAAAIAKLIARKPGLKAQKLSGDVGAGKRSSKKSNTDLLSIMKGMI